MPSPSSLLAQYAQLANKPTPIVKREQVDQASRKKLEDFGVPTPDQLYDVVTARRNGTGISMPEGPMQDLRQGNLADLYNSYGPDQASALVSAYAQAAGRNFVDRTSERGDWRTVGDLLGGLGIGAANTVGGVAALGAGLVSDDAGVAVSNGLKQFNDWAQSNQSSALNNRRRANESANRVAAQDNQVRYEQERIADGDFIASLRRIGRDAYSAVSNAMDDSTVLLDGAAQGAGSLLAIGPLSKGASILGSAALNGAAKFGIASGAVSAASTNAGRAYELAQKFGAAAKVPGVIAATEAGGAYTGTVNDIMAMSHEDLMQTSPDYADLIAQNWAPEDAKREVATSGGLTAAAIQAPVAALTGKLVSKFEASPFKVPSIGSAVRSVGLETVEEGLQSGAGQAATNIGVKAFADANRNISDGVGEQAGLGALYGSMSAGAVQAPGVAGRAAIGTGKLFVKGTLMGVGKASNAVLGRIERLNAANEASAPANEVATGQAAREYEQVAPDIATNLKTAVDETNVAPEQKAQTFQFLDDYLAATKFDPTPYESADTPAHVREAVSGATDKFDAIQRLAKLVNDTDTNSPEFGQAAFAFYNLMAENQDLATRQMPETILALPEDHPALARLRGHQQVLGDIDNTPKVVKAFQTIAGILEKQAAERTAPVELTAEQAQTPEGQALVQQTAMAAEISPLSIDQQLAEQISKHSEDGTIQLNGRQKQAINAALTLVRAANVTTERQKQLGLRQQDVVGAQVTTNDKTERGFKAAYAYMRDITQAVRSGNLARAKTEMNDLLEFAQHLQNKLAAVNATVGTDGGTQNRAKFQALNPLTREWFQSLAPAIHFGRAGSVELAQRIAIEADAVTRVANDLAALFPGLEAKPVARGELDPYLNRPAAEVVAEAEQGKRRAEQQAQPAATAQSEAEATQEEQMPEGISPESQLTAETAADRAAQMSDNEIDLRLEDLADKKLTDLSREERLVANAVRAEKARRAEQKAQPAAEPDKAVVVAEPNAGNQAEPQASANPVAESVSAEGEALTTSEPISQPEDAAATPASGGMKAVYPKLLGSKTKALTNWFLKAFKIPETAKTRIFGTTSPIEAIRTALSSAAKLGDYTGSALLERRFNADIAASYARFLEQADAVSAAVSNNLAEFLASDYNGKTIAEHLAEGREINRQLRGKALNIVEENEDGTFSYNPQLLEAAVLAGLQWILNVDKHINAVDEDAAAEILGVKVEDLDSDWVRDLNEGTGSAQITRSLAREISKYWGLDPDGKTPAGYVEGIPEAVAKEIIRGLVASGGLTVSEINTGSKTVDIYKPFILPAEEALHAFPDAIEQAVLIEPEESRFIGQAPKRIPRSQLRNELAPLTEQQKTAIEAEQATPHFLNPPMIRFFEALGELGVISLFGAGQTDGKALNKNHLKSLDGQNRTIHSAFMSLMGLVAEVRNLAEAEDALPEELPIHYEYEFSRVNRMQMQGRHNPQASKLVREAILPTWSVLDLSSQGTKDFAAFSLALAQALGIKVERVSRTESAEQVFKLLEDDLPKTTEIMRNWVDNEGLSKIDAFDPAWIKTIKEELGGNPSVAAIHALLDYARYQTASAEERQAFKTALYVEADGVTNGPINAMAILTSGQFSADWIRNMAKGGLLIGNAKALHEQRASDPKDLYETVTDALKVGLEKMRAGMRGTPAGQQLQAVLNLMDLILPDFEFRGEEMFLKRGLAKNPLTITIYGSGENGIAGNFAKALLDEIYARFSAASEAQVNDPELTNAMAMFGKEANGDPQRAEELWQRFHTSLNQLINFQLGKNGLYDTKRKFAPRRGTTFQELTFNRDDFRALQSNLLKVFVSPLRGAIETTLAGNMLRNADLLRKATQVQSIAMQFEFQREVAKLYEAKRQDPTWKVGDAVYRSELQAILKSLLVKYPLVRTQHQNFFIAASNSAEIDSASLAAASKDTESKAAKNKEKSAPELSRAYDESLRTPYEVYGPADSGVSGIPFLVIGTGDGQMMQNLATMDGAPTGTLKVFDGMHMKLSSIEEDSIKANQAAYEAWQSNPMQAAYTAFAVAADNISLDEMSKAEHRALAKALFGLAETEDTISVGEIKSEIRNLPELLKASADEIAARQRVLAKINFYVDQMASVSSPFFNEGGVDLSGLDPEQQAQLLNEMLREELSQTQEANENIRYLFGDETPAKQIASIEQALQQVGRVDGKSGARILSFTAVKNLNRILKAFPSEQRELLADTLRSLATKGYTIVVGSPAQTQAYAANHGKSYVAYSEGDKGVVRYSDKTIYLYEPSLETLVHELIHTATFEKVVAHYLGQLGDTEQAEAIRRTEALMEQFLELSRQFSTEDGLNEANTAARRAIEAALNDATVSPAIAKAKALNEFMAWALTNDALIKQGQKTEATGLGLLAQKAVAFIKRLVFGRKKAPAAGNDMFSQLRFNTAILMQGQPSLAVQLGDTASYQNAAFGQDDRLTALSDALSAKLVAFMTTGDTIQKDRAQKEAHAAYTIAGNMMVMFQQHGFSMTPQEESTFEMIMQVMATGTKLDGNIMAQAQELYAHAQKALKVEDFMADPESQDPADRYYAQDRYDAVMGKHLTEVDEAGRSTLLPAFLALSMTNDRFRAVLAKMAMPTKSMRKAKTFDGMLENLGNETMEKLALMTSGQDPKALNVQAALDSLSLSLVASAQSRQGMIDQIAAPTGRWIDQLNQWVVDAMGAMSRATANKAEQIKTQSNNKAVKAAAAVVEIAAKMATEEGGEAVAAGTMSLVNTTKLPLAFKRLVSDFIGRTKDNAEVYDMIKLVRSTVQQVRQQFREHLPDSIAKQFTRKLKEHEWTAMFKGMAMTDLAALKTFGKLNQAQVIELLVDDNARADKISALEADIQQMDPQYWSLLQRKSKELAKFMITREVASNLLTNAVAVADLLGENTKKRPAASKELISALNQLITLYAVNELDQSTMDTLVALAQTEQAGMGFSLAQLEYARKQEVLKVAANGAKYNHYKGYAPSESNGSASLVIEDDRPVNHAALLARGYKRVAKYQPSMRELVGAGRRVSKSYYYAPAPGRAGYNQGIMQNVRATAAGVDLETGFTTGLMTAGRITDPTAIKDILTSNMRDQGSPLIPRFSPAGKIVAFERSVDPIEAARLERSTHLGKMLGAWRGRQVEESMAQSVNESLVDNLKTMFDRDMTENPAKAAEYVDLFDTNNLDPVLQDAMKLMTDETRSYIYNTFGNRFLVRKDMVEDVVGYRSASLGDSWTGTTRLPKPVQDTVRNVAMAVMGNDAYTKLVNAERILQNVVIESKLFIVVKSVIVPASNIAANVLQLAARGVPIMAVARGMKNKLAEVDSYTRSRLRLLDAEAELNAVEDDPIKKRKLQAEIQSIKDGHKRLSIWPLIEAGEFSSISDVAITHDEILLSSGKLNAYIERMVDKLPDEVRTAGRYAIISRDTALFAGLQRAVQYGDFLAKAVLYDDLVGRKGMSQAEALGRISEEYVNYDRLPGRFRGALENNGLLWFYHFKIRSTKIALSMFRNNPVHALLSSFIPTPDILGSVGSPFSDNVIAMGLEGKLDYSMGPGQMFRAPMLLPWTNAFG